MVKICLFTVLDTERVFVLELEEIPLYTKLSFHCVKLSTDRYQTGSVLNVVCKPQITMGRKSHLQPYLIGLWRRCKGCG